MIAALSKDKIDLGRIARSGQCFLWSARGEDCYEIITINGSLSVRALSPSCLECSCTQKEWEEKWRAYFDWDTNYDEVIASVDPHDAYLTAAARAGAGIRILRQDVWETILSFLVSQNNNIPRIRTILFRLTEKYGAFPTADAIRNDPAPLYDVKMGYRAPYIEKCAEKYSMAEEKRLLSLGYAEAKTALLTYHGIGPKVADCICLFALGQKQAFPVDTWVKKIMDAHYGGIFPLEKYKETAGIMQQYMFFYEREKTRCH